MDTANAHKISDRNEISQEHYRRLYESTPAMLHSIDAQGRLVSVSDLWLSTLGYSRAEVIGKPSVNFLTPASRKKALTLILPRFFQQGFLKNVEYQMVTRKGEVIDVLLSAILERDAAGQVLRSNAVIQDITERRRAEHALVEERQRLAYIIEGTRAGTWEWNIQTGETHFNEQWAHIIGHTLQELEPVSMQAWYDRAHPDDFQRSEDILARHYAGEIPNYECQVRLRHSTGHWRWVLSRGRVQTWTADGKPEWMYGVDIDVTELKEQEEALRKNVIEAGRLRTELAEQHELLRITLQSIADAVITSDAQGNTLWLNPVAERMTGWTTEAARGQPLSRVFNVVEEGSRKAIANPLSVRPDKGKVSQPGQHQILISRSAEEFGIEATVSPIQADKSGALGYVLVFHDVTEQRRMSGEMNYRATHDALTGLVNRSEFESRLRQLILKSRDDESNHALLYIDLDQFKLVNDSCGHSVGDQMLQQAAKLFAEAVRSRDTLARLGGDEFAIILEHCPIEHAQRVAQQICDRLHQFRFVHDDRHFRMGASIGLVPIEGRWASAAGLMQAADTSCYAAKDSGRNRVHVWLDTDTGIRKRHGETQWAMRIEHALDENRFTLYAQRIECLAETPSRLRAEALVRMIDEDGSIIMPGAFLPAAERFHLASRIDRWVLQAAIGWLKGLSELSTIQLLCVNLSGQSIGDRAFHRFAIDALSSADASLCDRICLEITETAAVMNMADAAVFIQQVRALGVRVALDDFGAGASSFGYLKSLGVDYLKIDGQFIRHLLDDALDQAAVRCFVEVARVVGLKTVAEFVDDPRILAKVREMGIDYAQGFLVHRPEPIDRLLMKGS